MTPICTREDNSESVLLKMQEAANLLDQRNIRLSYVLMGSRVHQLWMEVRARDVVELDEGSYVSLGLRFRGAPVQLHQEGDDPNSILFGYHQPRPLPPRWLRSMKVGDRIQNGQESRILQDIDYQRGVVRTGTFGPDDVYRTLDTFLFEQLRDVWSPDKGDKILYQQVRNVDGERWVITAIGATTVTLTRGLRSILVPLEDLLGDPPLYGIAPDLPIPGRPLERDPEPLAMTTYVKDDDVLRNDDDFV